jgi:hypothetical protein
LFRAGLSRANRGCHGSMEAGDWRWLPRTRRRTDQCRATEVAVAVHVLNRMSELGRPNYVRIG